MLKWLGLSAALLLIVAGFAYATIPDLNGVIHGCYKSAGGPPAALGAVRVIDTDAGQTCASGETPLDWNQIGPQGPPGAAATALWAAVAGDATLLHGSHVTSVARRDGGPAGAYEVFFDQDVSQCAYLATMNTSGGTRGFVTAALTDSPTGVFVQTANSADILADRAFSVAVFC